MLPFVDLPDGALARPKEHLSGEELSMLAAVLKRLPGPTPRTRVRYLHLFAIEPALLTPRLAAGAKREWKRLVGPEAEELPKPTGPNLAWGAALAWLNGTGRLVESDDLENWGPGDGLNDIYTAGWPDQRAEFVMAVIDSLEARP